jgi:hypothetical protein
LSTPRRNSILGRRKPPQTKPAAPADGLWILHRQLNSRDPVLRIVAHEAMLPSPVIAARAACCRLCGDAVADRTDPICASCQSIRGEWEARAIGRFSIADRRGWVGPAIFTPEELLLRVQRQLRDRGHARVTANKRSTLGSRRGLKSPGSTYRSVPPSNAPDNPQKSSGPKADPTPSIRPARRMA